MAKKWIKHSGNGFPDLPMGINVQVRFRNGETSSPNQTVLYWRPCWDHSVTDENDIVAYRVVTK